MIRLFDVQNGVVVPTEHCYTLKFLTDIMDNYPHSKMQVLAYLYYMTCPDPDTNPFFEMPEHEKEEMILREVKATFSTEDDAIIYAKEQCEKLYQTPTYRAYMGIKGVLDKLAKYMEITEIEHGRDGNITAIVNAAAKFEQIRQSFKGALKDLKEEQQSRTRGGQNLAYDDE